MNDKEIQELISKITSQNTTNCAKWINKPVGFYRSHTKIKQIEGCELFIRATPLKTYIQTQKSVKNPFSRPLKMLRKSTKSSHKVPLFKKAVTWGHCKTRINTGVSGRGQDTPMGAHRGALTLTPTNQTPGQTLEQLPVNGVNLPVLSDFNKYISLVQARPDKPCLLIGYDSEWENLPNGLRDMLSWQFAVVFEDQLYEFVFVKTGNENLTLDVVLSCILDNLNYKAVRSRRLMVYKYCASWNFYENKPNISETFDWQEAKNKAAYVYRDGVGFCKELIRLQPDRFLNAKDRDWKYFHSHIDPDRLPKKDKINVCLVCHAGLVDLSGFDDGLEILKRLKQVQGGLLSLNNIIMLPRSLQNVNNKRVYPVSLGVADTMCHAPAGSKSLKKLGESVGIPKVDIPIIFKEHMRNFLLNDPAQYMEYAARDAVVTLLYSSALYGYNNKPPVTLTSCAAKVMKGVIMNTMNATDNDDFEKKYRGLRKVSHGNYQLPDRPGYIEATSLEPISDDVHTVQYYASQAYHGGYNSCSEVGYFSQETYDFDLRNAYPTAMCLVPDIDWEHPIKSTIFGRNLTIADFSVFGQPHPLISFVGYVQFKFPETCKYPCIPVNVDGIPVYPRTSDGLNGVYVTGVFVYLALKLGAEVFCEKGYFLNELYNPLKASLSFSLREAVVQLVRDRLQAKADNGKGCLQEKILKTMVNAMYGKTAQDVVQKQSWDAYKDCMEDLGCSPVTNPYSAALITSLVQCVLIAAQNQIEDLGYMTCSVTTDGFITDCPEDVLKKLDLFGLRPFFEQARLFLTDNKDSELWEMKHHQDDLINFTTRGNVSLHPHGVCAHNSAKSGFEPDSYEDRLWLMKAVLTRTGTVDCIDKEWSSFKDVVQGKTDFCVKTVIRHLHMDFDLKRKPDKNSFKTDYPVVDGSTYEIEHFKTTPFETVEEFREYRRRKKCCKCLRTKTDWDIFFYKLKNTDFMKQFTDLNRSIIMSIIMGYRAGKWDIPELSKPGMSVKDKVDFINKFNDGSKKFTENDWKNARRADRQSKMLTDNFLIEKLQEMQSGIPNIHKN